MNERSFDSPTSYLILVGDPNYRVAVSRIILFLQKRVFRSLCLSIILEIIFFKFWKNPLTTLKIFFSKKKKKKYFGHAPSNELFKKCSFEVRRPLFLKSLRIFFKLKRIFILFRLKRFERILFRDLFQRHKRVFPKRFPVSKLGPTRDLSLGPQFFTGSQTFPVSKLGPTRDLSLGPQFFRKFIGTFVGKYSQRFYNLFILIWEI